MTIHYLSDIHMEFEQNLEFLRRLQPTEGADVLVVAGDAFYLDTPPEEGGLFLKWAAANYGRVLLVPGNHEYYGGYDVARNGASWELRLAPNVSYYNNKVVRVGDTDFILSTMWSHISPENRQPISYFLSDFHRINYDGHAFTPEDYNLEHERSLQFIKQAVADSRALHRVVVTHHVPSRLCTPRKLRVIRGGSLEEAFTVDLTNYIRHAPIDCWIFGHSHVGTDTVIGGTRLASNQLGYVFRKEYEWNGFRFGKTITL